MFNPKLPKDNLFSDIWRNLDKKCRHDKQIFCYDCEEEMRKLTQDLNYHIIKIADKLGKKE